jgi:hypothetical protein
MKRTQVHSGTATPKTQSLIKLSSEMTGRELFEKEHKTEINEAVADRRDPQLSGRDQAGLYQTELKARWANESNKDEYEERAREQAGDIQQ